MLQGFTGLSRGFIFLWSEGQRSLKETKGGLSINAGSVVKNQNDFKMGSHQSYAVPIFVVSKTILFK